MNQIADLVESRLDEFAEAESRDQGKPVWLAKVVDIPRVCLNFRFFASGILHTINTWERRGMGVGVQWLLPRSWLRGHARNM